MSPEVFAFVFVEVVSAVSVLVSSVFPVVLAETTVVLVGFDGLVEFVELVEFVVLVGFVELVELAVVVVTGLSLTVNDVFGETFPAKSIASIS